MCGIAGFVDFGDGAASPEGSVASMIGAIRHRGPDDYGIWTDPASGVALGHRRLSILDLSPAGRQPMTSHCKRWAIVCNGEFYNHRWLRTKAEEKDPSHRWKGRSDTESFLGSISTRGLDWALEHCVGMFAFALWDRKDKVLILARDRMGEKPLYHGWLGDTFVFASEPAALYRHPKWDGEISRDALAIYLRCGYVPSPLSIFSNISKVRPGETLRLSPDKKTSVSVYWDIAKLARRRQADPFQGTKEDAVRELEKLMCRSIADQMVADVPLGAFLSGGIDSSTIVALMQSMSRAPVRTFTIGFHEAGHDEARHAADVAHHLKTDHTELYVKPRDALDVIQRLPELYSEPFADPSQIPTVLLANMARDSVKVSLSGDGGDELFCGYRRYALFEGLLQRLHMMSPLLRRLVARTVHCVPPEILDLLLHFPVKILPKKYRHDNVRNILYKIADALTLQDRGAIYRHLFSHVRAPEELVLQSQPPPTAWNRCDETSFFPSFSACMMHLDMTEYLPDDILTKVDRAAMGTGLETRIPLLDHRIVEFAASLPMGALRRGGTSKWVLRQVLYKYVPKRLVDRPKMGFGAPVKTWLRGPLREWGERLLARERLASDGFFDPDRVRAIWREHQSGKRDRPGVLWSILMFQSWLERHVAARRAA